MSDPVDDIAKLFGVAVFAGLILAALIGFVLVAPFVIAGAIPLVGGYVLYVKWRDDPNRGEGQSRRLLQSAYERAKGASLSDLDESDIVYRLTKHMRGNLALEAKMHLMLVGKHILDALDLDTHIPPPPAVANSIEGGRYLDRIAKISTHSPEYINETIDHIAVLLGYVADLIPHGDGTHEVPARHLIQDHRKVVMKIIDHIFQNDAMKPLRDMLDENLVNNKNVMPYEYKGDDVVDAYLKNTPLDDIFDFSVAFSIPTALRCEHHQIIATIGHGKTSTLISLFLDDMNEDAGMVVIDSQGDLISQLATRVPLDRLVLIDPEHCAPSLNVFDIRENSEKGIADALETLAYIFSTSGMGMTSKQAMVYSYLSRLCIKIPNATIHTLRELLTPNGTEKYSEQIAKLGESERAFFAEYSVAKHNQYNDTRAEILVRVSTMLSSGPFERMLGGHTMSIDIPKALNEGKVILVNTNASLLKDGSALLGRVFIGQVMQTVRSRPMKARKRVYLYVDEFGDYADESKILSDCFSQGRKYNLAMVVCFQLLTQLPTKLSAFISACTSIKFAGGVSVDDVSYMAKQMGTDVPTLNAQPKGTFLAYFKGLGVMPWKTELGRIDRVEELTELEDVYEEMRDRYRVTPKPVETPDESPAPEGDKPEFKENWG